MCWEYTYFDACSACKKKLGRCDKPPVPPGLSPIGRCCLYHTPQGCNVKLPFYKLHLVVPGDKRHGDDARINCFCLKAETAGTQLEKDAELEHKRINEKRQGMQIARAKQINETLAQDDSLIQQYREHRGPTSRMNRGLIAEGPNVFEQLIQEHQEKMKRWNEELDAQLFQESESWFP